jgi:hypothetical protein
MAVALNQDGFTQEAIGQQDLVPLADFHILLLLRNEKRVCKHS